jgi:hypothetical protein
MASLAGWTLSALNQLNRGGYVLFCGLVVGGVAFARRFFPSLDPVQQEPFAKRGREWKRVKLRKRFRRWLPGGFALLALLALVGGVLYAPTNHDALAYRTPRVLQWLANGHWFWIHTPNYRLNDRACGFEWLSAPLLLFTRSDRMLFILNFIPFLLLPGLIFSVFTRLGVRPRVAWHWMWLLPTGYNFLVQAGSIGNDTFPTVYALAAVDFALRAWEQRNASPAKSTTIRGGRLDLWLSFLAAALLTGAKPSNLPLLMPWSVLVFGPTCRRVAQGARQRLGFAGVLTLAALVSFLPTAYLNWRFCGDWSGLQLEAPNDPGIAMANPLVGMWGNGFILLLVNFTPTFFPFAGWWNQSALSWLPHALTVPMTKNFENGFLRLWEIPSEEWVGIGFGVSVLLLVSALAPLRRFSFGRHMVNRDGEAAAQKREPRQSSVVPARLCWSVLVLFWVALLAYSAKSGMATGARIISPYYPLLAPLLLISKSQTQLVRRRWWRALAGCVLLLAFPVVMLMPARPLWPARTVLARLHEIKPGWRLAGRSLDVYSVYAERADPLASARQLLPKGITVVGFLAGNADLDISLWRPFGSRRVAHILFTDSQSDILARHIQYAVVAESALAGHGASLQSWAQQNGAQVVAQTTARMQVSDAPQAWYLVEFAPLQQ